MGAGGGSVALAIVPVEGPGTLMQCWATQALWLPLHVGGPCIVASLHSFTLGSASRGSRIHS